MGSSGKHALTNVDTKARTADCAHCGSGVRIRPKRGSTGIVYWACRAASARRAPGPQSERRRRQNFRRKYGISVEDYEKLVEASGGVCGICGGTEKLQARLSVDHCHKTRTVRGVLCNRCNLGIGYFDDDPDRLRAAADYLTRSGLAVSTVPSRLTGAR